MSNEEKYYNLVEETQFTKVYEECELEDCGVGFIDHDEYTAMMDGDTLQYGYGEGFINIAAIATECQLARQSFDDKHEKRKTVKYEFPPHDGTGRIRDNIRRELAEYGLKYSTGRISKINETKKVPNRFYQEVRTNLGYGIAEYCRNSLGLDVNVKNLNTKHSQAKAITLIEQLQFSVDTWLDFMTSDACRFRIRLDEEGVVYAREWWEEAKLRLSLMKKQDCEFDKVVLPE